VTILSLNTWWGLDGHGVLRMGRYETEREQRARRRGLIEFIRSVDPDVAMLQEVCPLTPKSVREIEEGVCGVCTCRLANGGIKLFDFGIPWGFKDGLVIIARNGVSMRNTVSKQLSGPPVLLKDYMCVQLGETRWILGARIECAGTAVHVFNVHTHFSSPLDHKGRQRLEQLVSTGRIGRRAYVGLLRELEHSAARLYNEIRSAIEFVDVIVGRGCDPVVLGGDLNLEPSDTKAAEAFKQAGFRDMLQGDPRPTWDPATNCLAQKSGTPSYASGRQRAALDSLAAQYDQVSRRVDYIFLKDPHNRVRNTRADILEARDSAGDWISDHAAVISTLEFTNVEPQ
jgi:endonuclease/exonuclease/phosphatase family metal-dependent hydrolase